MTSQEFNYLDSGLSTPEAFEDARRRFRQSLSGKIPGRLAEFITRKMVFVMRIHCDSCPRVGRATSLPDGQSYWPKSGGWVFRNNCDFCPTCQQDGAMDRALAQGIKPRGA